MNAEKLKKAERKSYQKEQLEYIKSQINKIINSEDRQSQIAWLTLNKVSGRTITLRENLTAASLERLSILTIH